MSVVSNVIIGHGHIKFVKKVEEIPKSIKKEDGITITNTGRPEIPAYYNVSFGIEFDTVNSGIRASNRIIFNDVVLNSCLKSSYIDIENTSALKIASILRELADEIDDQTQITNDRINRI
jgi:hypothetical protein